MDNVKFFLLDSSTFAHVPALGVVVERSSRVVITSCIFLRLAPSSVTVRDTSVVQVQYSTVQYSTPAWSRSPTTR